MAAYLLWQKPISFQLVTNLLPSQLHPYTRKNGIFEVFVKPHDVSNFGGGYDPSKNTIVKCKVKDLLEDKIKNVDPTLKITFSDQIFEIVTPNTELRTAEKDVMIEGDLLQEIRSLFGSGVCVQIEIMKVATKTRRLSSESSQSKDTRGSSDMKIIEAEGDNRARCVGNISVPYVEWNTPWTSSDSGNDGLFYTAEMNLIVRVVQFPIIPPAEANASSMLRTTDAAEITKRLLEEQVCSDLEIVAGNGIGVKCHRAFLAVHSEVLKTMLESGLEESQTNKIPIRDVSEESVRAFLAYLYYQGLTKPMESSVVAIELIQLAHRYLIGCLEDAMKNILLKKPDNWFDLDATLRLFFFTGKLDNHPELRLKTIRILKSMGSAVMASAEYQRLFQVEANAEDENTSGWKAEAAKELCNALLSTSISP